MHIKCAHCELPTPVDPGAFLYCAVCGKELAEHPIVPNVREQVMATIAVQQQIQRFQGMTLMGLFASFFFVIPLFPEGSRIFLAIAAVILQFILVRGLKQRLIKKHPEIFANEWWRP